MFQFPWESDHNISMQKGFYGMLLRSAIVDGKDEEGKEAELNRGKMQRQQKPELTLPGGLQRG